MLEIIIHSEEELEQAFKDAHQKGYECACMSNAGLPEGVFRLSFIEKGRNDARRT